jgi:hypothetical protein
MVDNSTANFLMNQLQSGVNNGRAQAYLKLATQNQMMQQERLDRQAKQDDMRAQMNDFDTLTKLQMYGRPVENGMVPHEFTVDEQLSPVGNVPIGTKIKGLRKANNPYTYKDSKGQTHAYELYSPEELMQRESDAKASDAERSNKLRTKGVIEQRKQQLEQIGVKIPAPGGKPGETMTVLPGEVDDVGRAYGAYQQANRPQSASAQGWRAFTNYDTGDVSYTRVNPETGNVETKTADDLKGIAAPRQRGGPTSARSAGRSSSTGSGAARRPTAGEIAGMAQEVLQDSAKGGGSTIEHALANLDNKANYKGSPIGTYRWQIRAALAKEQQRMQREANRPGSPIKRAMSPQDAKWRESPAETAAATRQQPAAGKVASRAQVEAYAKQYKISTAEAEKRAKAEGYQVQ